jgi:hypothetical protein
MLFFTPGASASGKTSIIPWLERLLPEMTVYDFDRHPIQDEIGVMHTPGQRQQVAEAWIQTARVQGQRHSVVCGLGVMGEVLACPSAPAVDHIAFCLLDCDDVVRLDRIRRRGDVHLASMDMLCWAAWLRVHHVDPAFRPDVIREHGHASMVWSRWANWERHHPHWRCHRGDTTHGGRKWVCA